MVVGVVLGFFFFFWVGEVMVIDYDGWLCWQWVLRGGCGWLFLPNRKERERARDKEYSKS